MSQIRFGHVFFALMTLSFLSAFVIPPRITDVARAQVQNIFAPVSWPARKVGLWAHAKLVRDEPRDDGSPRAPRTAAEIIAENTRLRVSIENLQVQLSRLESLEGERANLHEARAFCTPYSVVGGDSGAGESLMIGGSSFSGLKVDMPVLYSGGIVGKISRVGAGGAQVLLVTDPHFKVEATFARAQRQPDGQVVFANIMEGSVLLQGAGNGEMMMRMTQKLVTEVGVQVNDWAVLNDRDWRTQLLGFRVGIVTKISPSRDPGFVEVRLKPDRALTTLDEVMVMNK